MSRPTSQPHPLDHPIWFALTSTQSQLAQGNALARRFPPAIVPLAAVAELSLECFTALHALMAPAELAGLFTLEPVSAPPGFGIAFAGTGVQMTGTPAKTAPLAEIVKLGADDAPEMVELVKLTRPGPLTLRTHELGTFLGIKVDGRLVAMAGERMKPAQFTEITAVCVHPDFRRRGYAQMLLSSISGQIVDRGEIPFLHVVSENVDAIALYRRQGMEIRRHIHVTFLLRAA